MRQIIAATGNAHKVEEMQAILAPLGIEVLSAKTAGGMPEVVEDGDTFAANAVKKAVETAQALQRTVLADDSGLEVFSLGGKPGIYSARYACEGGNDGRNVRKLLGKLDGSDDRAARFVCVIALASPDGLIGTSEGEVRGRIIHEPRGDHGFGYDPVFVPDGYEQTFAELPGEVKNQLSHRGNALQHAVASGLFDGLPAEP
jgi:XTP/dITP diphosphohydrolase